jgi:hypothetical protein
MPLGSQINSALVDEDRHFRRQSRRHLRQMAIYAHIRGV